MGFLVISLALSLASLGVAGVPDVDLSTASKAETEMVAVYVVADGSGDFITNAFLYPGLRTDATITLTLRDGTGTVIDGYPRSDMWLESFDSRPGPDDPLDPPAGGNGLRRCVNGSRADFDTNADGQTIWTNPLFGGGWSDPNATPAELCQVVVSGDALNVANDMTMFFFSPDINGDFATNLADVTDFSSDFFGFLNGTQTIEESFKSNLWWDATMDLADVTQLAGGLGRGCP